MVRAALRAARHSTPSGRTPRGRKAALRSVDRRPESTRFSARNARLMNEQVRFLSSAARPGDFPADEGVEIAFAGRSNSGKSSAINAITGRRGLARTSKTPGRTQLINFFELEPGRRLVDLPGYGYAKVSEATRQYWRELIGAYFAGRRSLRGVVLIMDARHPLRDLDRQLLAHTRGLPVHVLLTKADKMSRGEGAKVLAAVRRELALGASIQLFSALSGLGVDEARSVAAALLGNDLQPAG
jgi:GTP-binding protein